jgi:sterol carrier protein 2
VIAEARGVTNAPFAPQMFGNAGVEHMEKYGTKPEHFAQVAWKNHKVGPESPLRDGYIE